MKKSDQTDIEVFQKLFIEDSCQKLNEHYINLSPNLQNVLQDIGDLRQRKARLDSRKDKEAIKEQDQKIRESHEKIRELIEQDKETQYTILSSTRIIIEKDYQYSLGSIPFELFQNADDSYIQLSNNDSNAFVEILAKEDKFLFLHNGRKINQPTMDIFDDNNDSRDYQYRMRCDLDGMLGWHLSKKNTNDGRGREHLTGKFGLGFKSVFLLSDEPYIQSGRLRFKIVGSIYPVHIPTNVSPQYLESPFESCSTLIILPFRRDLQKIDNEKVLEQFRKLIHPLLTFAKKVKRCIVNQKSIFWKEIPVTGTDGVFVGTFEPYEDSLVKATRGLIFRSGSESVLFALNSDGFDSFESGVPTFWITAPSEERSNVGFLINSSRFQVDVGRSRLAKNEFNNNIAKEIGKKLGEQIIQLFKQAHDQWEMLTNELHLTVGHDQYVFWNSLWRLLGRNLASIKEDCEAGQDDCKTGLLYSILWGSSDMGAARLYREYQTLPSGLTGDYKKLLSLSDIRFSLKGNIVDNNELFEFITNTDKWESFRPKVQPGKTINEKNFRDISTLLRSKVAINDITNGVESIDFSQVLEWELGDCKIDPEKAKRLGYFLKQFQEILKKEGVDELLRKQEIEFLDENGWYQPCSKLVTQDCQDKNRDEERCRAAFAPDENRLSKKYADNDALSFFFRCRKMDADTETLCKWVRDANTTEKQKAAIDYLLRGELAWRVRKRLKESGYGWLENLPDMPLWRRMNVNEREELCEILYKPEWQNLDMGPVSSLLEIDSKQCLNNIYDWWIHNGKNEYLATYRQSVFPEELSENANLTEEMDDFENRKKWVSLFLLGILHTMGRTRPGQHRSFIELCKQKGWLDIFAQKDYQPDKWMRIIKEYVSNYQNEGEFLQWMKNFVGIFAISHYLDDHVMAFMAIDRINHPFCMDDITQTAKSGLFGGGGVVAPSITKHLGIGACFIVRELVINNIIGQVPPINNAHAYEHCYTPHKGVRDLFFRMGCHEIGDHASCEESKTIYKFLLDHLDEERATFDHCFDIPFNIIAYNDALKNIFKII